LRKSDDSAAAWRCVASFSRKGRRPCVPAKLLTSPVVFSS
jgi:hypothetical protein